MNFYQSFKIISLFLLVLLSINSYAQDDKETSGDNSFVVNINGMKGFHVGFAAGAFFANKYSASLYDGYGLDSNGVRNSFVNSALYRKIILENSGANGQTDNIAEAIHVNHDQWKFDESDMPQGLKYKTAFMFGLLLQYGINKNEGLILNFNFSKINVEGVFTLETNTNQVNPTLYDSILYFPVTGAEQRLMMQLGYCRVLGENDNLFNFIVEGGLAFNNAKYVKNVATINSLVLDLTTYNDLYYGNSYQPQTYSKFGYGVFGGFGVNFNSAKYMMQLIYNPSYERIGLGADPKLKFQQAAALRVYYTL